MASSGLTLAELRDQNGTTEPVHQLDAVRS